MKVIVVKKVKGVILRGNGVGEEEKEGKGGFGVGVVWSGEEWRKRVGWGRGKGGRRGRRRSGREGVRKKVLEKEKRDEKGRRGWIK